MSTHGSLKLPVVNRRMATHRPTQPRQAKASARKRANRAWQKDLIARMASGRGLTVAQFVHQKAGEVEQIRAQPVSVVKLMADFDPYFHPRHPESRYGDPYHYYPSYRR